MMDHQADHTAISATDRSWDGAAHGTSVATSATPETVGHRPARTDHHGRSRRDRADRLAERIAIPVLIAALAAVPAVFLTLFNEPYQSIGEGLNTLSGAVLIAETVVLFLVSEDRLGWLKRNWWLVALAAIIIPALIFAIAGLQLLRVMVVVRFLLSGVRFIGAFRIIRVGRILKAGRIVRERYGLEQRWQRAITLLVTILAAIFVAVVLADPSSQSRAWLVTVLTWLGPTGVVVAGLILAGATYVVYTQRRRDGAAGDRPVDGDRV